VNMSEATEPDPAAYPTFNAFFTRPLRADARPVDTAKDAVVSPVDGAVSQIGAIHSGRIFQAKGQGFSALELLGGSVDDARLFEEGSYATLYLSPRDYHRIHMPVAGGLRRMLHVPGRLFSVNPPTTRAVPRLFARNERVVSLFDTDAGPRAWLPAALPAHESAFALTVHKSQGSEFDDVLLVLPEKSVRVASRELLYTGITRARRSLTLWANENVLVDAIARRAQRWSGLADKLRG